MTGGAIMSLVAVGAMDAHLNQYNRSDRYSHEPSYTSFPDHGLVRSVNISRHGDLFSPEYIVIEQHDDEVKLKTVSLEIGGQTITKLDINFMRQLFPDMVRIRNNKVIYHLNMDKLYPNKYIQLISLSFHEVKVNIELTNESGINSIRLMNDYKYLDITPRRDMTVNSHEHLIFSHQTAQGESDTTNLHSTLHMNGVINGMFIEVESGIDNLTGFRIALNNINRFELDEIQIEYMCQVINQNMLYFPFTPGTDYFSTEFGGSTNLSRIDNVRVELTGNQALGGVKIHALSVNIFAYMSGMGGLRFNYNGGSSNLSHAVSYTSSYSSNTSSTSVTAVMEVIFKRYSGDDICLISLLDIEDDMIYTECNECSKAFIKEHLDEWLNTSRTCPHCRCSWSSSSPVYKNCETAEKETETNNTSTNNNVPVNINALVNINDEITDEDIDNIIAEDEIFDELDNTPIVSQSRSFLSRIIPFMRNSSARSINAC